MSERIAQLEEELARQIEINTALRECQKREAGPLPVPYCPHCKKSLSSE